MRQHLRQIVFGVFAVVLGAGTAHAQDDHFVIGGVQDLSGPLAYIGTGLSTGARAYFEAVNMNGGINGHQIRYLPLDHRNDTQVAIANVKSLVLGSNALAIIGFDSSVIVDASMGEIERNKIVGIVQGASPASVSNAWTFSSAAFIADEAPPMIELAIERTGKKNPEVAVLTQQSAVLAAWLKNLLPELEKRGVPLVENQAVALGSTEINAQIAAVAKSAPEVVFSTMSGPKIPLAISGLRKLGFNGPIIGHTPAADVVSLKSANDPDFFVMRELVFASDEGSGVAEMNENIRKIGGDPNTAWVINGYLQGVIIGEGLKRCGWPCDSDKLRSVLEEAPIDTGGIAFSPLVYQPGNHEGITKVRFYMWDGAKGEAKAISGDIAY
jgi:branched-chain amino acid transport system substrate-binding protein